MALSIPPLGGHVVIPKPGLQRIFDALREAGYSIVGPRIRDGAIVYHEIATMSDLPIGWTDDQAPGNYRLRNRGDRRYFGFVVGPQSWKRYLFPPRLKLFSARRTPEGFEVETNGEATPRYAFIGVRACELAAIAVQDRVFLEGATVDPTYKARRQAVFTLAVNCLE